MLDMLLHSSDDLLPTSGILGFLVHNWLAVAVVILVLGFALDQVFYVLLDRPQDRWRRRYRALRAFLTAHFGAPAMKAPAPEPADGPVIHRAGAKYSPHTAPKLEPDPEPLSAPQPKPSPRPEPGPHFEENQTVTRSARQEEPVFRPIRRQPEAEETKRFGQIVTPPPAPREEPVFAPLDDEDAPVVIRPDEALPPRSAEPVTARRYAQSKENGEEN